MKEKIYLNFVIILLILMAKSSNAQIKTSYKVSSPDKSTQIEIGLDQQGKLVYRVFYGLKEALTWSALGFNLNEVTAGDKTVILSNNQSKHTETFAWRLGENDHIENNYQEMVLSCQSSSLKFNIIARVFNGSIAFKYEIPAQATFKNGRIKQENTQFNLIDPYTIYQYHQETVFTPTNIDTLKSSCDFPATLSSKNLYISIGEASNCNYTKAELKKGTELHSLAVVFPKDSVVKTAGAYQTPWRTISFSKTAIGLHDFSQLYLKLNPPAKAAVTGIKAGKLIRAQLNTQSGLDCIDFAAKHNFQYIMFDAGWYGAEFRSSADPTTPIPQINMPEVLQYGKEKGIGVILYVNYVGLKAKLDTLIPLYKKWGVSGFKFGFVDGLTQNGLSWLSSAIKKVNDAGFILDIHDNYKPTGLSRTYPALLTQEGIRGDENSPDAFHTTVLPFTRFLAGPADFTFCYPNSKSSFSKNLKVSKAQQLALSVVYFSPLQSIFWYGQPNDYTNEQEIEFFKLVPTVWNETHYLAGEIGENISVARRSGNTWFVGNAAGLMDWKGKINLNFLSKRVTYSATVYEDDEHGSILKRTIKVKKEDSIPVQIKAKGGQAIVFLPYKN